MRVEQAVPTEGRGRLVRAGAAVALWAGLVSITHVWGERLVARDRPARIFAAPLVGRFDPRLGGCRLLPAVLLAAGAVAFAIPIARRASWRTLLVAGFVLCAAWALALAFVDGWSALTAPLATRWDYLVDVPQVHGVGDFLRHFADRVGAYSTHVRAHPPGLLLLLSALDRMGLGGPGAAAALVVAGGAATVPAAAMAVREVAGERAARTAWPFLVFVPAVLWIATSADALFAGVAAWGVTLVVLATGRSDRRGDVLALAGGLLLGAGAFLSFGLVLTWLIPTAVVIARHRWRTLAHAAVGIAAIVAAFAAAGFWWPDGLAATRVQYVHSAARARPQHYFWIGNLGAFAVALGPAAVVGFAGLRHRRAWLLVGAALLAIAVADASGYSKGEVERIWLPFAPWILLATSSLDHERGARLLLGLQVATALGVQLMVRSPW